MEYPIQYFMEDEMIIKQTDGNEIEVKAIQPELWPGGGWHISPIDEFSRAWINSIGRGWENCFWLETGLEPTPRVMIHITARPNKKYFRHSWWEQAISIEFLGDGEPSSFSGGVALLKNGG